MTAPQFPNADINAHRLAWRRAMSKTEKLGSATGAYCTAKGCKWGGKFKAGWRITEARNDFQQHLYDLAPKIGDTPPMFVVPS